MKENLSERLDNGAFVTCFNSKINTVSDGDKFSVVKYTGENQNDILRFFGVQNLSLNDNNFFVEGSANKKLFLYEEISKNEFISNPEAKIVVSSFGNFEKVEIKQGDVLKFNEQSKLIELIPSANVQKELSKLESMEYKTTKICFSNENIVFENNKEDWQYALSCNITDNKNIFPLVESISLMELTDKKGILKASKIFVNEHERNFLPNVSSEIKQISFTYYKRGAELVKNILDIEFKNQYSKVERENMPDYDKKLEEYREKQGFSSERIEDKLAENIQDAEESKDYEVLDKIGEDVE